MSKYSKMIRLKIKRIEKGFSQGDLAEKVGATRQMISAYECGMYFPRREMLDRIAQALDCEIKDIF